MRSSLKNRVSAILAKHGIQRPYPDSRLLHCAKLGAERPSPDQKQRRALDVARNDEAGQDDALGCWRQPRSLSASPAALA
jgi:hypothetical protein